MKCEYCGGEIILSEVFAWPIGKFTCDETCPCVACRRLHFIMDNEGKRDSFLVESKGRDVFLDKRGNATIEDDNVELTFLRE